MFITRKEMLMSPESETSGGAGGTEQKAGGEQNQQPVVNDDVNTLKAELAAIKKNRDEILAEKKALKEEFTTLKSASSEEAKKKALADNNFEKLFQIESEAKKELQEKLELIERSQNEEKEKIVKTHMWNSFTKALGAELHDAGLAEKVVDWTKFVPDAKGEFNADGIKQAVNSFREKYSYMLKTDSKSLPADAAKSTADDPSKMSFADRVAKSGLTLGGKN